MDRLLKERPQCRRIVLDSSNRIFIVVGGYITHLVESMEQTTHGELD